MENPRNFKIDDMIVTKEGHIGRVINVIKYSFEWVTYRYIIKDEEMEYSALVQNTKHITDDDLLFPSDFDNYMKLSTTGLAWQFDQLFKNNRSVTVK